jgi:hypothetical protein
LFISLYKTLFIGTPPSLPPQPLDHILEHYAIIRDAIANTEHLKPYDLKTFVCNTSFIYAFNTYKAISLLLPELYYESGATVLRQLWEVSLNLHWIGIEPKKHAKNFCNFTIIEERKFIHKLNDETLLQSFDNATKRFQKNFQYKNKHNHDCRHKNFTANNIQSRADKLGNPWKYEYKFMYHLTSMYAHGAPGAVLHGMFQACYPNPDTQERNLASLIAMLAIKVIVRNVELLVKLGIIPDATNVMNAFEAFQTTIATINTSKTKSKKPDKSTPKT